MKRLTVAGLMLGILLMSVCAFGAAVPLVINYSGTLTNASGVPVPDGTYNIEFNVYNIQTAGTPLWNEKWSATATPASPVLVTGGVFNVMLGAITPFPVDFFQNNPNTYLGIKVGTDSEMLPRQKIASVGYAFAAGNGVPKGGIIMWSGAVTAIPEGWALCDGSNGTPNLKDRFVIGAGAGYVVGATGGEATHILTSNEMPVHTHSDRGHAHADAGHAHAYTVWGIDGAAGPGGGDGSAYGFNTGTGYANIQTGYAALNNTGSGLAHNNLPPYYALAYIMKL